MALYIDEKNGDAIYIGEGDLLSRRELCEKFQISRSTVQRMIKRGMPCKRYQHGILAFNLDEVTRWLLEQGYPPVTFRQRQRRDKNK